MPPTLDAPRAQQIGLILEQIEALPTLSPVATRLMQISSVQDADLDPIVELIESDLTLTGRILGLCRRSDKGLGDRITTVRRAVVMLGLESIQSVVLGVSVYDLMGTRLGPAIEEQSPGTPDMPGFQHTGFWKHSVSVAAASGLIAEAHPGLKIAPQEAFVAGLMHDVGKLVLELVLPRSYCRVLQLAERRACASAHIERELFGIDHHTAAKRLAEHWGLPHALQDVMWLHSQPAESLPDLPHKPLIGIVNAARSLTRELMLGWSGDFSNVPELEGAAGVCRSFGLDHALARGTIPRLHEETAYRCAVLGLDKPTSADLMLESIASANQRLARLNTLLQHRSLRSEEQSRAIACISDFQSTWRPGRNVSETLGDVAASARSWLGAGFFAIVIQTRAGEPWQLHRFDAGPDAPARVHLIGAPSMGLGSLTEAIAGETRQAEASTQADLDALARTERASVGGLALLPWVTEHLADAVDLRRVQIMPLHQSAERRGPSALLLHDRPVAQGLRERGAMQALQSTWSAAIAGALQHEGARRLSERLAGANRDLVALQQRLAESQSMVRLGEMAAGAAHEMNNPLTVISGRGQILAERLTDATDQAAARSIVASARQMSDLITSLRLVADPPAPALVTCEIEPIIRDAIAKAEQRTGLSGRFVPRIDGSLPESMLDRELAAAAIAELLVNALEASPETPVEIRAHIDPSDSRLMILVKDQGPGMSARALHHAFDPFFSEKPAGRQTGLGLVRARRWVELMQGEISLSSLTGVGTTATIAWPAQTSSAGHLPTRPLAAA
jgi:signal transduction histidine kinase/HD-like signal output (HDOD) protein